MPGKRSDKKKVYSVEVGDLEHFTDDPADLSAIPAGSSIKVIEMTEKQYERIRMSDATSKFFGHE
jgi:hypothetical protein